MTSYWKNVTSVLTGSVVAQLIPLLGSLAIARLYAPAEFGTYSAWLGMAMLLAVLLTCRYDMAFAIESDGQPRRLAVLSTLITLMLVGGCVLVALVVGFLCVPELFSEYPFMLVLTWLPAGWLLAANNVWQSWAAAEGEYRKLSYMRIAQTGFITSLQIIVGVALSSAAALALSHLIGLALSLVVSVYMLVLRGLPKTGVFGDVVSFWKRQRKFPAYSLPADFINTAAAQLPILIVTSRFGAEVAGMLALTMKVLGAPIGLLGKSVLDVFKRHAAESYRDRGDCRDEYVKTFKVLALGSLAFCAIMVFASESLFIVAFGKVWAGAGTIAVWLLPMFALRFIASPLSYMVYIAERQHLDLMWQIGLLAMTLFCLATLSGYNVALQAYSAGYSALYFIYLGMSYRFSLGVKN
ncbi:lipopolysaccharide biosynthesis protein [Marinobacter sp. BGYM27]|uniref:lipopolysaccharide biosynthesis protein n=1 Tax=Marinobacter sp. BGYM27 TaxID=2975597 RepID=UPI0021A8B4A2|nr:lipopolysaccharide biosynthesis protein [Marinobacter sp. BGYM27]MDG5499214.1 lipopolysaccharide biosynthesis protein [Marinobacter sp. BGYM27]